MTLKTLQNSNRRFHTQWILASLLVGLTSNVGLARKGSQSLYEDPFDLAAGGASLTRASRDGRLFANPALLPYGGKIHRWLGSTTSILINQGICELALNPCVLSSSDTATSESSTDQDVLDLVFTKPIRLGLMQNLSWVTSHLGFSFFTRNEADLRARKVGDNGTPVVDFEAESYTGLQVAFAMRSPIRWFSLGGAVKAVVASEPSLNLGLEILDELDQGRPENFFKAKLVDNFAPKLGYGADIGALFFFQGHNIDTLVAVKVDDVGDTKLSPLSGVSIEGKATDPEADAQASEETTDEATDPTIDVTENDGANDAGSDGLQALKQVVSVGTGFTLHTAASQIHFSLDYRDILGAYKEPMFKRIHAGMKVTIGTYVGLSSGIYHGYYTYGIEADLIFMNITALSYKRELSDKPGLDPRRNYLISISSGI